jgi:hypothetical protein
LLFSPVLRSLGFIQFLIHEGRLTFLARKLFKSGAKLSIGWMSYKK